MRKQNNLTKDASRNCATARSVSPSSTVSTARPGRRRRARRQRPRPHPPNISTKFGYQIQDVDEFLAKASLDSPGNIPMVLSTPCVLYQTQTGAPQKEVNISFKKKNCKNIMGSGISAAGYGRQRSAQEPSMAVRANTPRRRRLRPLRLLPPPRHPPAALPPTTLLGHANRHIPPTLR